MGLHERPSRRATDGEEDRNAADAQTRNPTHARPAERAVDSAGRAWCFEGAGCAGNRLHTERSTESG